MIVGSISFLIRFWHLCWRESEAQPTKGAEMTASTLVLVVIGGAAGLLLSALLMFGARNRGNRRRRGAIDPVMHTHARS